MVGTYMCDAVVYEAWNSLQAFSPGFPLGAMVQAYMYIAHAYSQNKHFAKHLILVYEYVHI